jgi:uncharacterized SAM-binding protein YcdF (DUF218 family)
LVIWLGSKAGTFLVKGDPVDRSDATVVLMGSIPDNVLYTSELYHQGLAHRIIIVREYAGKWKLLMIRGIFPQIGVDQFRDVAVKLGVPADSIYILPGDTRSTRDEAVVIRQYALDHPSIHSVTVICSSSHSRRAGMIFRKAFKKAGLPVTIKVNPSPYSDYDGKGWWKDREEIQTVVYEYLKMAAFLVIDQWKL